MPLVAYDALFMTLRIFESCHEPPQCTLLYFNACRYFTSTARRYYFRSQDLMTGQSGFLDQPSKTRRLKPLDIELFGALSQYRADEGALRRHAFVKMKILAKTAMRLDRGLLSCFPAACHFSRAYGSAFKT